MVGIEALFSSILFLPAFFSLSPRLESLFIGYEYQFRILIPVYAFPFVSDTKTRRHFTHFIRTSL